MPLTYAHYRFGKKCIEKLPNDLKNIVNNNIDYFNYGCQGPDIFYYHSLIKNDEIKKYGMFLYSLDTCTILSKFKINLQEIKNRDAALSYILGYISHFLLDSYCNTYIEKATKVSNISKLTIEKEIEKYFYIKDKINTNKYDISSVFKPSKDIVKTVMNLHGNFKESIYKEIIYDYKTKLFLLNDLNPFKRKYLSACAKLLNRKEYIESLSEDSFNKCLAFCIRCDKYFEISAIHYTYLIKNFMNYLIKDEPLIKYFDNNCLSKDINDITVLNIKKEKEYIISKLQD